MQRHMQIVGIIDENGNIESILCTFQKPIYHKDHWPKAKKLWRYDGYRGITESEFSKVKLNKEDIEKIKKHIGEKYD